MVLDYLSRVFYNVTSRVSSLWGFLSGIHVEGSSAAKLFDFVPASPENHHFRKLLKFVCIFFFFFLEKFSKIQNRADWLRELFSNDSENCCSKQSPRFPKYKAARTDSQNLTAELTHNEKTLFTEKKSSVCSPRRKIFFCTPSTMYEHWCCSTVRCSSTSVYIRRSIQRRSVDQNGVMTKP